MPADFSPHDPGEHLARLETSYEAEAAFRPELDLPFEPVVAEASATATTGRARGADGKFAAEPKEYAHNRTVSQLARDLGYTAEEIGRTAPEILEDRVYHVHRRTVELLQAERSVHGNGIHAPPAASQPVQQPVPEEEPDLSFLDENLQKHLKKQSDTIKQLKSELDGQKQAVTARSQEQQLDRIFEEMGRDDLFGKGGVRDLGDTADKDRRLAVYNKARTFPSGTDAERIRKASEWLFGTKQSPRAEPATDNPYDAPRGQPRERVPENLQRERDRWDDGSLARPSHRQPGPLSPETRAAMKANEIMRENPDMLGNFSDDRDP